MTRIQRALFSVTDKTGIVDFGKELQGLEVEILSTGGTAKTLREGGVKVVEVSDYTGFPECFDDRVKTLHPKVAGGILFERDKEEHRKQAAELGVKKLDLVVVNLYRFEEVAAKPGVTIEELIKNMDIGGPTMLKEAVKNNNDVVVLTDPRAYEKFISELRELGEISTVTRKRLAAEAMNRVADYESAIAVALTKALTGEETIRIVGRNGEKLSRYGENWHQNVKKFAIATSEPNVVGGKQLRKVDMGYNNYLDADNALQTVMEYEEPAAVVVKHQNPCGAATGDSLEIALERGWQGDPVSAFGSILALNREVDLDTIKVLGERKNGSGKKGWMVEVIVAPSFTKEALNYIEEKAKVQESKKNLRVIAVGQLDKPQDEYDLRFVRGGVLKQSRDNKLYLTDSIDDLFQPPRAMRCQNSGKDLSVGIVTTASPDPNLKGLYDFAYKTVKHIKSNAIAIAREYAPGKFQLIGMGAGQPSRVESARIAVKKAEEVFQREYEMITNPESEKEYPILAKGIQALRSSFQAGTTYEQYKQQELKKCAAASDAFFPFADGPTVLAEFGIRNFIQPGGGNNDKDIIETVNKYNAAMILTGARHFLH